MLFLAFVIPPVMANERSPSDWMNQGIKALKEGDFSHAAKWLGKAARASKDPSQKSKAYYHQGIAYFGWGEWGSALSSFEKAKDGASDDLKKDLNYYIGNCYYELGHRDSAITHLTTAKQSAPSPDIRYKSNLILNRAERQKKRPFSVFTNLGYLFDSNVILESPSGHVHGEIGAKGEIDAKDAHSISLALTPAFSRPLLKKSYFTVQNLFYGQGYFSNSTEQFNFFEIAPTVSLMTPVSVKHVPVHWLNSFNYRAVFSADDEGVFSDSEGDADDAIDQIKNIFLYSTSAKLVYSPRWDLTWGIGAGYVDYKEGDGSIFSASGRLFRTNLASSFKTFTYLPIVWTPAFTFSSLTKTGEQQKFRKSELNLSAQFPFYFRSLMSIHGDGYYTSFPDHRQNRRDTGWTVGGRLSRFLNGKLGGAVHGQYTENKGRHVESSFKRGVIGTNLFYTFN